MATHSSILAWEILWTEEPGWLQSRVTRVGHNSATKQHKNVKLVLTNRYIKNKSMSDCDIFRVLMSLDSSWHPT